MIAIGFFVGIMMGWHFYDAIFLGAALSISSTTIIIKAITDLRLKTKHFSELIFGVLIVEDLLAILLLVALSTLVVTNNLFSYTMLNAAFKLILVVGAWFLMGYFLVPPIFREIANYINNETLTIVSIALCLGLVCVAAYFQYSTALGAFYYGINLGRNHFSPPNRRINCAHPRYFRSRIFYLHRHAHQSHYYYQNWQAVLFISLVTLSEKLSQHDRCFANQVKVSILLYVLDLAWHKLVNFLLSLLHSAQA